MKSRDGRKPGSADREVLAGLVERVTFHNPDNGFCVLRVKARGHRDLVTVVGHAAMVAAGEWITASREWVHDRTHGQQFRARFLRSSAPSSVEGIDKVSRLGHDPGHRPGLRPQAGTGVRRSGVRRHRGGARAAARGQRHRPGPGRAHHRRLGRAEGRARDHGLPAQPRGGHGAGRAHFQDLRGRRRRGHDGEPVPSGARHSRHRVQDGRCHRDEAGHREDGADPGARRHRLRADRGDGRGSPRVAARGARAAGGPPARGARRRDPDRAGAGAGRGHGRRGRGGGHPVRIPRGVVPGRAGDR